MICRTFAEEGITLTDLFEELAVSLEACQSELDETGFVSTYLSLALNRHYLRKPKAHRTALSELDYMLEGNLEVLSLDALADLANLFV